ncbi:hypothetical protein N9M86_02730 [Euryarchaeota archaeon]|nr:hypothetical protein [Euryarchaeota archaeon]MDA8689984.1 hypothetical protein [Euryarchaeota archaeon]MDA9156305.1 hypothetical protein [Candidatus Poseidoniaceae archaeon]MDA9156314.1 hypothetical protein [Candidatus Poseidoniaceae archaeon]
MVEIFNPATTSTKGLSEFAPDSTAGRKLVFYHASEGKPLATPWQVALTRSKLLTELNLPEGYILDCACGSGIQLGAHMAILQRPGIGVELDPLRAQASAVNLQSIATYRNETDAERMQQTRIFASDGRDGAVVCAALADHFSLDTFPKIALLHLDPARPRNSRTHGLEEMAPRLDEVFNGWAPYLSEGLHGPAVILDLSPRLTHEQRLEVESLVDAVWKDIARTWVWTSRGRGRVDRLALWLGDAATKGIARRFVRIPPSIAEDAHVVSGGRQLGAGDGLPKSTRQPPRRGERVSILDAALVESGLAETWLASVSKSEVFTWGVVEGRRPQIHHAHPLRLDNPMDRMLVQATGRVVALARMELRIETVDQLVELFLEHDIGKMTVRVPLSPEIQPKVQGAIDRQLSRRHGRRNAFLAQQPGDDMLLVCITE